MSFCCFFSCSADETCHSTAYYLLEIGSREGQHCRAELCKEHVRKAWGFGQRLLDKRFPRRHATLCSIRLTCKARSTGAHHCAKHSSAIAEPASTWSGINQPHHRYRTGREPSITSVVLVWITTETARGSGPRR